LPISNFGYEQYLIKVILTIALVTLWMGQMCIKNINRDVPIKECGKIAWYLRSLERTPSSNLRDQQDGARIGLPEGVNRFVII